MCRLCKNEEAIFEDIYIDREVVQEAALIVPLGGVESWVK
jgi:hypothetical protein